MCVGCTLPFNHCKRDLWGNGVSSFPIIHIKKYVIFLSSGKFCYAFFLFRKVEIDMVLIFFCVLVSPWVKLERSFH
jgi:hypothetical protein